MSQSGFSISVNIDAIRRLKNALGSEKAVAGIVLGELARQSNIVAGEIVKDSLSGQRLKRRTGNLARSVVGKAEMWNGLPAIRLGVFTGPSVAYAGVQEFGTKSYNPSSPYADIRPKGGRKYLAIPTDDGGATTPTGRARYRSAKDMPGLAFVPGLFTAKVNGVETRGSAALFKGRDVLQVRFEMQAEGLPPDENAELFQARLNRLKKAYLLVRRARIKPKFYLRDGLTRALPSIVAGLTARLVEEIEKAGNRR
jgi:hypothetical protein